MMNSRSYFKEKPPLPGHGPHNHKIPILPGKEPKYMPIYQLLEKESAVLWAYINNNLKKGYIRHSNSPAGYPILYILKKDGSLCPCIDY
jgi:hypothetical protein